MGLALLTIFLLSETSASRAQPRSRLRRAPFVELSFILEDPGRIHYRKSPRFQTFTYSSQKKTYAADTQWVC